MNAMLSKIKSEFSDDCKSRILWKLEKNRTKGKREKKNINQLVIDIIQAHTPAASSSKTEAGGIFKDFILKITP
jgi:hypothetical protein